MGSQTHRQNLPHDPDYRDPSPARVSRGRYRKQLLASSTWEGKLFAFSGDPSILVCHSTLANQISRHQTLQSKPSFCPVSIAQTTPSSTSHRHPPAHSLAAPVRPLRQSKPLERTALQSGRETPPARSIGPLRRRRRPHRWSSPRRSSPTATALLSATARRPVESWTTRPAEPRTAVVAAALLGYAVLSIAMTLAFKAALQAFPYPASLVAATFVVEAALVKSAECGARAAACVFPKEETTETKRCCVFPDETDRLCVYVACCVGAEVALSNAGLLLLSVATHTMIKACTPVFVLGAGLALKLEPCRWSSICVSYLCGDGSLFPGRRGSPSSREGLVTRRLADGIGWRRRRPPVGADPKSLSERCASEAHRVGKEDAADVGCFFFWS